MACRQTALWVEHMLARLGRVIFWTCNGLATLAVLISLGITVYFIGRAVSEQSTVIFPGIVVSSGLPWDRYGGIGDVAYDPDTGMGWVGRKASHNWEKTKVAKHPDGSVAVLNGPGWTVIPRDAVVPRNPHWAHSAWVEFAVWSAVLGLLLSAAIFGVGRGIRYILANE